MAIFTAAAIQMRSGTEPERNAEDFEELVREAARAGAAYVQTPEMTGAVVRDREARSRAFRLEESDGIAIAARRLAAELGIFLHVGSTAIVRPDGKLANRAMLFAPDGALLARYDKIHMFDVDLDKGESWRESEAYEPGRQAVVVDIGMARLGLAICYDVRFPQLFRAEALAGADVLAVPAAFTRQTGEAHWHVLLRARAIENGAFVVAEDGAVVAACRYLDAPAEGVEVPLGLGSRHVAGAAASTLEQVVAIVVSKSGIVRVFCHGELLAETENG